MEKPKSILKERTCPPLIFLNILNLVTQKVQRPLKRKSQSQAKIKLIQTKKQGGQTQDGHEHFFATSHHNWVMIGLHIQFWSACGAIRNSCLHDPCNYQLRRAHLHFHCFAFAPTASLLSTPADILYLMKVLRVILLVPKLKINIIILKRFQDPNKATLTF